MDPQAALSGWENFYVIVGSSAGALTGLQFVVISLATERQLMGKDREISAFATPTIVHFCAVLALSAAISAPWYALWALALTLGLSAAIGVAYIAWITRLATRTTGYKPVLEDWLFHCVLPILAYAIILISAVVIGWLPYDSHGALFSIGVAALLLLFAGIHNAWDSVVYFAKDRQQSGDKSKT